MHKPKKITSRRKMMREKMKTTSPSTHLKATLALCDGSTNLEILLTISLTPLRRLIFLDNLPLIPPHQTVLTNCIYSTILNIWERYRFFSLILFPRPLPPLLLLLSFLSAFPPPFHL